MTTGKCPYCAEEIQTEARKCKHCGEYLDETLREARGAGAAPQEPIVVKQQTGCLGTTLIVLGILALILLIFGL